MSEFIVSFIDSINPKTKFKMKFYSHLFKNQWAFYLLPFVYIYLETCNPESHVTFWKNKICGLYLSFNCFKFTYIIGIYKPIN